MKISKNELYEFVDRLVSTANNDVMDNSRGDIYIREAVKNALKSRELINYILKQMKIKD